MRLIITRAFYYGAVVASILMMTLLCIDLQAQEWNDAAIDIIVMGFDVGAAYVNWRMLQEMTNGKRTS